METTKAAPQIFDRPLLVRRRARALAARKVGGTPDFLLQRVGDDFAERLSVVKREFPVTLDLGTLTGAVAERIGGLPSIGRIVRAGAALDREADHSEIAVSHTAPSPRPRQARLRAGLGTFSPTGEGSPAATINADEEALPFGEASLDLIVSGLTLHLVNDLPGALIQMRCALKPDGLLLAALLGGDTLRELREAWLIAEDEICGGASPRVAPFADVRDLGGLLQRAGFALPVADADVVRVTYASPLALMREIKAMGASNMLTARRRVPVTKTFLARACEVYEQRFGLENGRIPATFEIITLTAWCPHESQQKPLQPGSAKARLADALGVKEVKTGEKAGGG